MRLASVLFITLLLVGCDGIGQRTDAEYVERAQDHLDKGELRAASIELKNALVQNPNHPQARWLLGKIYLEFGQYAAAEKELTRARDLSHAQSGRCLVGNE